MQNRRNFFGHLGLIIAASAAPMILVPKTPVNWGKPLIYMPVTHKLKCVWSDELVQDLMAYHNVDAKAELNALLNHYIQQEVPNREILAIHKVQMHYDPVNFSPRKSVWVTVNEPVI